MKELVCVIPVRSFGFSKSRLSNFLTSDETISLQKCMLEDIVTNIISEVSEIILVSRDSKVYDFAKSLGISYIKENEHEDNRLNNALIDAMDIVKSNYANYDILILPSDIPLIKKEHISTLKSFDYDIILSPSKGGGTNLIYFKNEFNFVPMFGDMSYLRHIEEANYLGMSINIIESFYLSLDVNTPEDLGEILIHGIGTKTIDYLMSLNIDVKSSHGGQRLNVKRIDE